MPSVKAVTGVFFLLYLLAIFGAMRFSSRYSSTGIPAALRRLLIALNSLTFFDLYFQYWPLRTFFPCLALWLAPVG